jgi:polysaccharide export outer membrane protein
MVPNSKSVSHSQTWTFFQGQWHEGNVPIMGPRTHGLWLGSTVFDGARAFEGVTDARRAVLLSSTRKLQTTAQLMQVKKQQDELTRKLEKLDDQRRLDLLRELQDTSVKLNEIREKLQSVGEKLQYTAMVRSQLARGAGNKAEIAIIGKGEKGQDRTIASDDTELQPGDTVEVSLRYDDGPYAPLRRLGNSNISLGIGRADATGDDSLRVGRR